MRHLATHVGRSCDNQGPISTFPFFCSVICRIGPVGISITLSTTVYNNNNNMVSEAIKLFD